MKTMVTKGQIKGDMKFSINYPYPTNVYKYLELI